MMEWWNNGILFKNALTNALNLKRLLRFARNGIFGMAE
jgi:hypothetical protein